jgi:PAS domain S-box-containing protein
MQSLETAAGALLRGQFAPVGRTGVAEIDQALNAFEASSVALLQREDQFRTLADSIPQLAWMAEGQGKIFWFNQRWFDYTGASLHDMEGPNWRKVHHPDHAERVLAGLRRSWQSGEPWEDTFPLRGADGKYHWFLSRALPIRDRAGTVVRWFGTHTDISEQKQTEDRQRLLVNELNHRVKNTLAVIQSIAAVTSRSASNAAAFSASFIARIVGISRTHDLLTASHWEGADLRDVVWNELAPYDTDTARRVGLHGEPVHLSPKIAVTLGMVMHEMATNAAKYGALSQADGRVDVTWYVCPDANGARLHIEWAEEGGPPMPKPGQQGFGSRLILQSVERDLEGTVKFDYRPTGLHCAVDFPLAEAGAPAQAAE